MNTIDLHYATRNLDYAAEKLLMFATRLKDAEMNGVFRGAEYFAPVDDLFEIQTDIRRLVITLSNELVRLEMTEKASCDRPYPEEKTAGMYSSSTDSQSGMTINEIQNNS